MDVEKLEGSRVKFNVEISAELLEQGLQKAYIKTKSRYNIPGFRRGKAPRFIIEQHYGELAFFEDAFDEIFPDAYDAAVAEAGISAVGRPEIDFEKVSRQEGVVCIVKVDVKPEVELGEYKGIDIEIEKYSITAKDVNAEIERLREQNCGFETAERAAKDGDKVVIDYAGSVDGVAFEGGTAENQTLDLGSGSFIPGFEEQVCGMEKGDVKDIEVTFPEDYHAEELAGKKAVFNVKLHEVKEKKLPELDDEFAKDVSEEYETLADMKKGIKKKMTDALAEQLKTYKEDRAIEAACKNAKVEVPASMVNAQIEHQLQDMSYNLMRQGLKLEDYLKYTGMTIEALAEQQRPQAAEIVKSQLVMAAIIKAEDITATDEQVDAYVKDLAEKAGKPEEEYKELLTDEVKEDVRGRICWEAAIELITKSDNFIETEKKKEAKATKKAEKAQEAAE